MYISASAPDAPPFNETTIGCFIRLFFWIAACIMRAIWSDAPPAPAATTISTGLVGSQANAGALANVRPHRAAAKKRMSCIHSSSFWIAALARPLGAPASWRSPKGPPWPPPPLPFPRPPGQPQAHLHPGERPHQGQVVEIPEVADAEHLAGELAQSRAERHVESLKDHLAHAICILPGRRDHRSERAGVLSRVEREDLEPPSTHRASRRLPVALVARENGVEAFFLEEHGERLAQAVKQVRRRRVREVAVLAVRQHLVPRPIAARHLRRLGGGERLGRDAIERQPGGQHEALLRAGDR